MRRQPSKMSTSVISVVGRLEAPATASNEPAAVPVSLPTAPVEHIRAEEADNGEQLSRAYSAPEDWLIFPSLVRNSLLSARILILTL